MKTINAFFILLTFIFVSNSYAQTQPDKETTQEYIKKIFNDTYKFERISPEGYVYSLEGYRTNSFDIYFQSKGIIEFGLFAKTAGKCSYGYQFSEINWAKMQNIEDWKSVASNSPVQFLYVLFPANSILRLGYTNSDCKEDSFSYYGTQQSVNYVLIPYLNQEGIKARLIKALNHLSKLEKEEQAKNDPFGN